jgi:TetR/AcrR family transcriptional repressor of nem operon
METTAQNIEMPESKCKLLDAAVQLILQQGFSATTVDQICAQAGLTKGAFFHYFKSKEEIGEMALDHFCCKQAESLGKGCFNKMEDSLECFHGFLDFFLEKTSESKMCNCLIGNLTQEVAQTYPEIRCKCEASFNQFIERLTGILTKAKEQYPPKTDFDPRSVATFFASLLQGSIILAKAQQKTGGMRENLEHYRTYVENLFGRKRKSEG